jgi:dipeptidyl aminopeptidase/acylaminoacyl peptidase
MPSGGYEMPEAMRDAVMNDFGEVPTTPEDEILGGSANASEEGRRAISALTYVTAAAPPFLFIHGAEDRGVPPLQSELLSAALADAGVATELVIVPDAAHVFDGVDPMPQLERAVDFLAKNLVRA